MSELYKELEEKPYIDAFDYIEYLGKKIEDRTLIKINRFLQEDRKKKNKEIERLNNIIEKYKKHLKEYDKWLDYNTEIGNLYWYDATPFPKLELKESEKQ